MLSVKTNLSALNAQRQLNVTTNKTAKSAEKLSSGYKINKSADDAAGLAISEKMRRQIRGLTQGLQNTQEGVSVCQVADGALAEVDEMLHRITELSVKAANGIHIDSDRQAIQQEVLYLLREINRIGDDTQFNEQYIFRGIDVPRTGADGTSIAAGRIPFGDFSIADVGLGYSPFGSGGNGLRLQAIVNNPDSPAYGRSYNLIYGNGSTSNSSIRLTYEKDGVTVSPVIVSFSSSDLIIGNYQEGEDEDGKSWWTRDLTYRNDDGVDITITQRIVADDGEEGAAEKNYNFSYSFKNEGIAVNMDFMFHIDTAYNNNDRCEGYFTNNERIDKSCIYNEAGSEFTQGSRNSNIHSGIPDSFSVVDVDNALAFSEKVTFLDEYGKPDSLSIGYYYSIDDWGYYDNLDSNLGHNMINQDMGFSLMWRFDLSAASSEDDSVGTKTVGFNYGIVAAEEDENLGDLNINSDSAIVVDHISKIPMWIHAGSEAGAGIWLELEEMNTTTLGIDGLDVSVAEGAEQALDSVKEALANVSKLRSALGAQQNRLEHAIANEDNIVENTTAAESLIRDTDIAKTMVDYVNQTILSQAGISVLAHTNQQPDYILQLLQ